MFRFIQFSFATSLLRGIYKAAIEKEHKDLNKSYASIFDENTLQIILDLVDSSLYQKNEFVENVRSIFNKDIFWQFEEVEESFRVVTEDILASFKEQSKENVICLCNVMKNLVISKVNEIKGYLTKEESSEYTKKLRKIAKEYEKVKKESFEKEPKLKKDYYLDILLLFLENPRNYYYIERILEVVASKMEEESIDTFVDATLDLFIKNYKLKIANQKLAYTDPDYYFHILKYLSENGLVPKGKREKLNQVLNDFNDCLCEKKESPARNEALMAIETLKNNKPMEPEKDKTLIEDIKKTVLERMNYLSRKQRKQDSDYPTKTFAVGKFAYSMQYNDEGDLYFRIHLLDGSAFVFENDLMNERLKKHMLLSEKIPFHLPYQEGQVYPVLTFQYRIYKNQSYQFKIFEDTIHIDAVYQMEELKNYREIPDLKSLVGSYKKLKKAGDDDSLDMYTESILLKEILKFFQLCPKEIPCIYKRPIEKMVEDTKVDNHNQICTFLSKIDKKTAHQIFSILDETRKDIYCSYITDSTYVELEPFRYDTILLERTLKQIINETYDFNEKYDSNKGQVISYCKALNEKNGYVSELFFEKEKKKVKKN